MITIKLPIQIPNDENLNFINQLRQQQSSLIRSSFNRFKNKLSQKDIRNQSKDLNNMDLLDSWFIQSGIIVAKGLYESIGDKKVIFGGRKNWNLYQKNLITKEEWKKRRLNPLHIEGESPQFGNRKFNLDIENGLIIFKPFRGKQIELQLPKLRKNWTKNLLELQELANQKLVPYTIDLTDKEISISFEPNEKQRLQSIIKRPYTENTTRTKAKNKLKQLSIKETRNNYRILGIDLNPNYIGLSVIQFDKQDDFKVLYKEVIDFKGLNNKKNYSNDKKRHETVEVAKYIVGLVDHWNCSRLSIEELKISSFDKGEGRYFNRCCNNVWHRDLMVRQLEKRCMWSGIELIKVGPYYSSVVGNINYGSVDTPDMVASSIEIGRRAYRKFRKGWFYPMLIGIDNLKNLWKEDIDWSLLTWREIAHKIKELELRYRFQLEGSFDAVFRFRSLKSRTILYSFI